MLEKMNTEKPNKDFSVSAQLKNHSRRSVKIYLQKDMKDKYTTKNKIKRYIYNASVNLFSEQKDINHYRKEVHPYRIGYCSRNDNDRRCNLSANIFIYMFLLCKNKKKI